MRRKGGPLAQLAGRQHGIVSVRQLAAAGFDDAAVRREVAAGRLHRVHRGVYAVGHSRLTREARWLAAVLRCGCDAVLSHRSAAALWGIRPSAAVNVDVTVPRNRGNRPKPGINVHRSRRPIAATVRDAIPVTTPAQTLIDLSSVLPLPALERAFEAAESLRLLDLKSLPPRLAKLAGVVEPRLRSPLEARFRSWCRDRKLPEPRVNAIVEGLEVDFSWPEQRLIVETDGGRHLTPAAFERDRARDARLTALGWRAMRFTRRQVRRDPEIVAARVISARSPWLLTPG